MVAGDNNTAADVFVRDRQAGTTERVSVGAGGVEANGASSSKVGISVDGRYVAFTSIASNLVAAGTDTNGVDDVFVRDHGATPAPTTERVSVTASSSRIAGVLRSTQFSTMF